ncbi:hypothetical protein DLJ49_11130 [Rhodovulum sp. 12E13]|nr:hypothetical protein DLJ49_11130 [Rhodovulum sp. 12E13]
MLLEPLARSLAAAGEPHGAGRLGSDPKRRKLPGQPGLTEDTPGAPGRHRDGEVDCISKRKARVRYEFGCKVSVATTHGEGFVVGMRAMAGNP